VSLIASFIISLIVLGAFFTCIILLFHRTDDFAPGVKDALLILIGVLAGESKEVVSYWLGSSADRAPKPAETKP
jgi:hypothetical protein